MAKKNGVELAKAYVQIIPSMEGMQENIETALNGGGGVGGIGSRAGNMLGSAFTKAFTAAAGFLKDSIETGMGFDSAMSQVAATMGKTTDEIAELRDYAKEMGATTVFSATQSAEALNYMALAGYDAETSMKMLPQVMDLAAAGGMELASASDMVTDSQTALGLSIEDTEKLVDQMAKTASTTNTSVSQLGDAILTVGGTAKGLADGTDELNQVLGIMADNGIKASEAGTHLRNIMLAMNPTTKDAKEAFDQLNFSAYDSEGKLREMSDIFGELGGKLKEMTPQDRDSVITKIFKVTDLTAVNALLDTTSERWDEVAQAIEGAGGAAAAMADTQMDNLEGDITLLKSAFEGLQIEISEELTDDIRGLIQVATEGLTWLTDHATDLIGTIKAIGVTALAMNLPAILGAAKTAMLAFNAACAANPLGLALSAISAGVIFISTQIDKMTDQINEIPDAFEGLDTEQVDFVKMLAEGTDDLAEAEKRCAEAEEMFHAAQDKRNSLQEELASAQEELRAINEKWVITQDEKLRRQELEREIIPGLTADIKSQNAAVGELGAAYLQAKDNTEALTEAQEQLAADTEAATIAEEEQAAAEEDLAAKKEAFAEQLKESMKEAITANIELNDKTVRLSRDTAERMGEIIDSYDEMYAHQKQAIEGSFDLFDGFTADTSLTFDTLMKNLKDTSFYMNDWATTIEQLGKKGVSKGLLDELKSMGGDSWQIVYAMNHATQEQLDEYSSLWEKTQTQITTTTDRMMKAEKDNVEAELSALAGIPDTKIEEIKAAFEKAGYTGVKGYADSIRDHFDEAEKAVDELVNKQLEKLKSDETITEFSEMGKNVYLGLAQGMNDPSVTTALDSAVEVIVRRVVKKTQEGFEINSPSKVFDEMGVYIPEGLAGGVVRGTDSAEAAIQYMTDTVIDAAQDELTGADLGLDLSVNALDRVVSSADYRSGAADYDGGYTAPERKTPATIVFELDSHEIARATFPDINELLGRTTALQTRGYA